MALSKEIVVKLLPSVTNWHVGANKPATEQVYDGWKVTNSKGEIISLKVLMGFKEVLTLHGFSDSLVKAMPNKKVWITVAFAGEEGAWLKNHVPELDLSFDPSFKHINLLIDVLNEENKPGHGRGYYGFGEAGVGKTSTAAWLAAVLNQPVVQMNCKPNMEVEEMFISHTCHDGVWDQSEGPILQAVHHNVPLIIDELDLAPQEFVPALNNLIEGRKFSVPFLEESVVQAGDCFKIIGFGNTGSYGGEVGSYNGRSSLDASTLDRLYKDFYEPLSIDRYKAVIRKNFTAEMIDDDLAEKIANFSFQLNNSARDGAFPEMLSPRGVIAICRQALNNQKVVRQPMLYAIGVVLGSVLESEEYLETMLTAYSSYISDSVSDTNALNELWKHRAEAKDKTEEIIAVAKAVTKSESTNTKAA